MGTYVKWSGNNILENSSKRLITDEQINKWNHYNNTIHDLSTYIELTPDNIYDYCEAITDDNGNQTFDPSTLDQSKKYIIKLGLDKLTPNPLTLPSATYSENTCTNPLYYNGMPYMGGRVFQGNFNLDQTISSFLCTLFNVTSIDQIYNETYATPTLSIDTNPDSDNFNMLLKFFKYIKFYFTDTGKKITNCDFEYALFASYANKVYDSSTATFNELQSPSGTISITTVEGLPPVQISKDDKTYQVIGAINGYPAQSIGSVPNLYGFNGKLTYDVAKRNGTTLTGMNTYLSNMCYPFEFTESTLRVYSYTTKDQEESPTLNYLYCKSDRLYIAAISSEDITNARNIDNIGISSSSNMFKVDVTKAGGTVTGKNMTHNLIQQNPLKFIFTRTDDGKEDAVFNYDNSNNTTIDLSHWSTVGKFQYLTRLATSISSSMTNPYEGTGLAALRVDIKCPAAEKVEGGKNSGHIYIDHTSLKGDITMSLTLRRPLTLVIDGVNKKYDNSVDNSDTIDFDTLLSRTLSNTQITNWNSATKTGCYTSKYISEDEYAANAPIQNKSFVGYVTRGLSTVVQKLYIDSDDTTDITEYIRKGTIEPSGSITFGSWYSLNYSVLN